jgi:hypothetical protein
MRAPMLPAPAPSFDNLDALIDAKIEAKIEAKINNRLASLVPGMKPSRVNDAGAAKLLNTSADSLQTMLSANRRAEREGRSPPFDLPPHTGQGKWRSWCPLEIRAWQDGLAPIRGRRS